MRDSDGLERERDTMVTRDYTINVTLQPNAGLMLAQRRRRWANINTTLATELSFGGIFSKTFFIYFSHMKNMYGSYLML